MTVADYPDYATPAEHARQISVTGAPLLNLKTLLAQQAALLSIAAGTSKTISNVPVSQVSYEVGITAQTAANAAITVTVTLQWSDFTTGLIIQLQKFSFFAGTAAAPHTVEGHGPSGADTLTVIINNGSATNAISVKYAILQSSRPYLKHLWRTQSTAISAPVIPTFTFAPSDPASGILLAASDSLAANGHALYLLPLYTGDVFMDMRTSDGTAGNAQWRITAEYLAGVFTSNIIFLVQSGASGFGANGQGSYQSGFTLPRGQCSIQGNNLNGTTTETLVENMLSTQE